MGEKERAMTPSATASWPSVPMADMSATWRRKDRNRWLSPMEWKVNLTLNFCEGVEWCLMIQLTFTPWHGGTTSSFNQNISGWNWKCGRSRSCRSLIRVQKRDMSPEAAPGEDSFETRPPD